MDKLIAVGSGIFNRMKDMGDGSHAPVVTLADPSASKTLKTITTSTPGTGFLSVPPVVIDPEGGAAATVDFLKLVSGIVAAPGTGYVPADTIDAAGGTQTTRGKFNVATTKVVSATINAAGTGGTNGAHQTVTGTTGTGTKFQADVTIAGGIITAVNSILVAGAYSANPTDITQEPVTGAGLTGAKLAVVTGVNTVTVNTAGAYTVLPANPVAQNATSGAGTGATINAAWGIGTVTVTDGGLFGADTTPAASVGGAGTGATFAVTTQNISPHGGMPVDYTNGTGQFSGTTITIPANPNRKFLFVQNRDTTAVTVAVAATKASDGTATTSSLSLGVAGGAGGAGERYERTLSDYVPLGAITITGTNTKQVTALEG